MCAFKNENTLSSSSLSIYIYNTHASNLHVFAPPETSLFLGLSLSLSLSLARLLTRFEFACEDFFPVDATSEQPRRARVWGVKCNPKQYA
jgi:hypothetical protein